jgi:hypothetical protein
MRKIPASTSNKYYKPPAGMPDCLTFAFLTRCRLINITSFHPYNESPTIPLRQKSSSMVCKLPPRPTCAPDPLTLLALPAELRLCTYIRTWDLAEGCDKDAKPPLQFRRFNFFSLPSELRCCIYEFLLKPTQVDLSSYDYSEDTDDEDNSGEDDAGETSKADRVIILYANRVGPKRPNPAILRTCKTVYAEAKTFLYRPLDLALRPAFAYRAKPREFAEHNSDVDTLCRELRAYDMAKLHCIQELSRMQIELFTTSTTKDEDIAHSKAMIASFRGKIKVGRLELRIFNRLFGAFNKNEAHHAVEKETTFELIVMWSKVLAPKELRVLIGDKPGIVLECQSDGHGTTSKWKSAFPSGRSCRMRFEAALIRL